MLEIEPNFETQFGKIELTQDSSFGIRYGNMMSLIKTINTYLDINSDKLKQPNSFKDFFVVNDIISSEPDSEQIIKLVTQFTFNK